MVKSRFLPLLRTPIRMLVSLLALLTGLSHVSTLGGSPNNSLGSAPVAPPVLQSGCDGGGDSGGGDYCDPSHLDSCFCGCTASPCFGSGCGDNGGGDNSCYYGWNYWGDCGPG